MFSLKAVPEQRQTAKQQLNETFRDLQKTYTDTLQQSLKRELEISLKQFTDSLSPRLGELEEKIEIGVRSRVTAGVARSCLAEMSK